MSLISQITQLFQQWRNRDRGAQTTAAEAPRQQRQGAGDELAKLSADQTRRATIKTCQKMYDEDPRADDVLHTLARDMVGAGFTVTTGNAKADQVAADLMTRIDLVSRLDDWIRLSARDGDSFLEVEVSAEREIVGMTRKPTLEMYRNSNQQDHFDDPTRAFWWSDSPYQTGKPPADALWFAEWQMIHARWSHDEGQRYGRPLFKSATGAWKRISEGEIDVATRRKTRAGMKYNHMFPPGTTQQDIEKYKVDNADILNLPLAAIQDFFGTADIKTVEGDARLGEIEDILHHIRTWWLASPVPMSLLGYGQDLNRDVLQEQKEQYDETLENLRPWTEKEILRPLFELAWLLAGILPDTLTVEYHWKAKKVLKPVDLRDIADAGVRLRALGMPDTAVWKLIERFIPDVDWDTLLEPSGEAAEGTPAVTADTADRLTARINGEEDAD